MRIKCSTTEDAVWIQLPFRVKVENKTLRQARRIAVDYRERNYMARVLPDRTNVDRWMVAIHRPRRRPAGGRELTV